MLREQGFAIERDRSRAHLDEATLEAEFKYAGYVRQHDAQLARTRAQEAPGIPQGFEYRGIPGLSREAVERLSHRASGDDRPGGRVPGVTPAAVAIVAASLARRRATVPPSLA